MNMENEDKIIVELFAKKIQEAYDKGYPLFKQDFSARGDSGNDIQRTAKSNKTGY